MFFAKDFIETAEGLIFAVVEQGLEDGKVLCFLRYVLMSSGWNKVATEQANNLLQQQYPDYLHYSPILDAHLHAVDVDRIVKHHQALRHVVECCQQAVVVAAKLGPLPTSGDEERNADEADQRPTVMTRKCDSRVRHD